MSFPIPNRKIQKLFSKVMNIPPQLYGVLFGHQNYDRFAIIGYARTGSNYVAGGINSSRSVHMFHEIFAAHNRELGKNFDKIMSKLYRKQEKRIRNVGFKLFYYHLTENEWKKFLSYKDISIIHLTRRNHLRTLVSLEIAFKTNRWTSGNSKLSLESRIVYLDPDKLLKDIEKIIKYENITRDRFRDRKMMEVVYEDVVKDPINQFTQIGNFLGITDIDHQKIHIRKQNPEVLKNLIGNFDEVSYSLKNTRFAEYLTS